MSDLRIQHLVLDRGIESITHAQTNAQQALPQGGGDTLLADMGVQGHMEKLLRQPTFDSQLDAHLRPVLEDRALLQPSGSREALEICRQLLGEAALRYQEGSGEARDLGRAVRLVTEESSLRDMAQMLRSALYQG